MTQERPEEEQLEPDEQYDEPDIPNDATVIRQVPLAWFWSSVPWLVVAILLYFPIGLFEEITILLVALVVVIPRYISQRRTSYTITDRSLIYERGGIFGVQRVPIPIDRLKDVRTKFGLFGKTLGYQTVDVMLDNGSVADLSYVPIYMDVAGLLREMIDDAAEYEDDPLDEDDEIDDGGDDDGRGRRALP
jgi:uncharacterized membrane protein YdbT with pleckstrin-like domain